MVRLKRVELPTWPCNAEMNSGRVAWFSIFSGSASESASTLPAESITVTRAPAARAACMVISLQGCRRRILHPGSEHQGLLAERSLDLAAQHAFPRLPDEHVQREGARRDEQQRCEKQLQEDATSHRGSLRFRDLEAVACSADRLQITRIVGVLLRFFHECGAHKRPPIAG